MNQRERHAWHTFRETMAKRQPEFDGMVPIALLVLATCPGCEACRERKAREGDDITAVDVHIDGTLNVLRPPGMEPEEIAFVFARAADQVRKGAA